MRLQVLLQQNVLPGRSCVVVFSSADEAATCVDKMHGRSVAVAVVDIQ